MKLKPGTLVRLTDSALKWHKENSDQTWGYPDYLKTKQDILSHFMLKYSFDRELDVDGIVIEKSDGSFNTYLLWVGNELGEEIAYFDPEDFEVL